MRRARVVCYLLEPGRLRFLAARRGLPRLADAAQPSSQQLLGEKEVEMNLFLFWL